MTTKKESKFVSLFKSDGFKSLLSSIVSILIGLLKFFTPNKSVMFDPIPADNEQTCSTSQVALLAIVAITSSEILIFPILLFSISYST